MPGLLDPLTDLSPGAVASGPPGRRRIDLFFTVPEIGRMGSANLWHRRWTEGAGWEPAGWYRRGGSWTSATLATAFSGGRVDLFGLGVDGGLWHTWGLGNGLDRRGEWERRSLGSPRDWTIVTSPAPIALGPARLLVAVRARHTGGAHGLWFASLEGGTEITPPRWRWVRRLAEGWPTAQRTFATALGIASRRPGALDLFTATTNFELVHSWLDGDTTSPWGGFGNRRPEGGLTSSPSAAVWQSDTASSVHVVACYGPFLAGPGTDPGRVELKSWLGRHWTPQSPIYTGGRTDGRWVVGPPAVVSWGKPRLDVFFLSAANPVTNEDAGITHGWSDGGAHRGGWRWDVLPLPRLT
ncbi:MAG: hypothetical protein M3203_11605 [Actinomycetota bacterium]|nr:hypothetical protein [Actinomycetota bacterium]